MIDQHPSLLFMEWQWIWYGLPRIMVDGTCEEVFDGSMPFRIDDCFLRPYGFMKSFIDWQTFYLKLDHEIFRMYGYCSSLLVRVFVPPDLDWICSSEWKWTCIPCSCISLWLYCMAWDLYEIWDEIPFDLAIDCSTYRLLIDLCMWYTFLLVIWWSTYQGFSLPGPLIFLYKEIDGLTEAHGLLKW